MIRAVLLDLDDTLLRLDTDAFARKYLGALCGFLMKNYPDITPETFQKTAGRAIRATAMTNDPALTNGVVMNRIFATDLGIPDADLVRLFDQFYADHFAGLRGDAAPVDGAAELIAQLHDAGLMIVLATNPVFALPLVQDRMRWAGFEPEKLPLKLVTHYDNMHFTKPLPHYYEEILARVGVEAEDAIMVGDSLENDIVPASKTGMATFWIDDGRPLPETIQPNGKGTLRDFAHCVREGWLDTFVPRPRTATQLRPRMMGNLAALNGLASEMDAASWTIRPFANEWTPLELVSHLLDAEIHVHRAQIMRILEENNPFLPPSPTPKAAGEWNVDELDGPTVLADFCKERIKTLTLLDSLTPEQFQRPARHSIFGPTTLLEMAHFTARHDRLHINQLCELIGACQV